MWDGETFKERKSSSYPGRCDVPLTRRLPFSVHVGSSRVYVYPQPSRMCKLPIQYKKKDTKSVNLDLDCFLILPGSYDTCLKRIDNGENVQRENKVIFSSVDMVIQSHTHITPGRSGT